MDFQPIGMLPAAGNSNSLKQYSLTDNAPNYINHYRIKQVDNDGRFTYSKILYVKIVSASPLQLLQNIVQTDLRYQVNAEMSGSKLEIYDMTGKTVYTTVTKTGVQLINVYGWSAGKYLIRLIANNGQVYSHQFIKQ
jgi:Secretion system C-terminal sorting domain